MLPEILKGLNLKKIRKNPVKKYHGLSAAGLRCEDGRRSMEYGAGRALF